MNPTQSTRDVVQQLSAARWEFDCNGCAFDTYGGADIHKLAIEHVAETGHTMRVSKKQSGAFWLAVHDAD